MLKRLLAGLAISTLMVGVWFAVSEPSVSASQDAIAPAFSAVPDSRRTPRASERAPSVDQEMRARERYARINMILYTGRFGGGESAKNTQLDAVALKVTTR